MTPQEVLQNLQMYREEEEEEEEVVVVLQLHCFETTSQTMMWE